jgi:hypothetical protein
MPTSQPQIQQEDEFKEFYNKIFKATDNGGIIPVFNFEDGYGTGRSFENLARFKKAKMTEDLRKAKFVIYQVTAKPADICPDKRSKGAKWLLDFVDLVNKDESTNVVCNRIFITSFDLHRRMNN